MLIKSVFKEILQWYVVETQAPPQAHSINFEGLDCLKCPNVRCFFFFFCISQRSEVF